MALFFYLWWGCSFFSLFVLFPFLHGGVVFLLVKLHGGVVHPSLLFLKGIDRPLFFLLCTFFFPYWRDTLFLSRLICLDPA